MSPMPVLLQSAAQVQALPEESAAAATELASTGGAAAAVAPPAPDCRKAARLSGRVCGRPSPPIAWVRA